MAGQPLSTHSQLNNCSPTATASPTASQNMDVENQETMITTTIVKATIFAGFYPSNQNNNTIPKFSSASKRNMNPATRDEGRGFRETINDRILRLLDVWQNQFQNFCAAFQLKFNRLKVEISRFVNSSAFHEILCLMVLALLVFQLFAMLSMNVAYCRGWPLCIFENSLPSNASSKQNACETAVFRHFLKNCNFNRVGYLDGRAVPFRDETLEMSLSYYLVLIFSSLFFTMVLPFFATSEDNDHPLFYFTTVVLYLATMTQLLVDIALYLPMLVLFGERVLRLHYSALYCVTAIWQIMQAVYLLAVSHRRSRQMVQRNREQYHHLRRHRQQRGQMLIRRTAGEQEDESRF